MNFDSLLLNYAAFIESAITDRFVKHNVVEQLLEQLPSDFRVETKGYSEEGRSLNLVTWGRGKCKIFLWSQMHGNEATGTMSLFDLINFLKDPAQQETADTIADECTLYMLPMVNPDGAERFIRRNANQIDINRDFIDTLTKEAKVLRNLRDEINPDYAFNLHDQDTLWSVQGSLKSATLSYLAPSYDENSSVNETRTRAMQVVADIFETLTNFLPGRIGLFQDEFEPRAFGDNFQLAGTSTLLLESGGFKEDDEKQEIRKYFFISILKGLLSIATGSFKEKNVVQYQDIPKNNKQIFHVLIQNVAVNGLTTSIGLNYEDAFNPSDLTVKRTYYIKDIGDLRYCNAYTTYEGSKLTINGFILIDSLATLDLFEKDRRILSFSYGILV
ncbi:MAG: M14 family zinc carboxypeptidase [Pedobacter sp.]